MKSDNKTARIAGLLYLVVVLTGIFSLAYVPSKLIVWDNPGNTYNNIRTAETLFRSGLVSGLVCYVFFLLLPIALYKLLSHVNECYAKLMVLFAVISVPVSFINMQNKFAVLSIINGGHYNTFTNEQLQSQVMFYLNQYNSGIEMVAVFWGLWLLPFGYLVYKSGMLPKLLGVLLQLGCFGYIFNFLGTTLIPGYAEMGISTYISLPATLGEIGTCLWLLIMGTKNKKMSDQL